MTNIGTRWESQREIRECRGSSMAEQLLCKHQVGGSNPLLGSQIVLTILFFKFKIEMQKEVLSN